MWVKDTISRPEILAFGDSGTKPEEARPGEKGVRETGSVRVSDNPGVVRRWFAGAVDEPGCVLDSDGAADAWTALPGADRLTLYHAETK
jgi:hypothetical protein